VPIDALLHKMAVSRTPVPQHPALVSVNPGKHKKQARTIVNFVKLVRFWASNFVDILPQRALKSEETFPL